MKKRRILVVEDERVIAEDIKYTLEKLGYSVTSITPYAEEALEKAEHERPNLVLMDIMLKGKMNGIEAGQQIRSNLRIPVIYLTAHADDKTFEQAKITEPFGYIIKPFEERELHSAIELALYKHKMEEALRESEERFKQFFENSPEFCYIISSRGLILDVNKSALEILGYDMEKLIGHSFLNIYAPESKSNLKKLYNKWKKSGKLRNEEITIISKNGRKRIVLLSVDSIKEENGNLLYYIAAQRDITDRKRAQEDLKISEERLKILFEYAPDAYYLTDMEGKLVDGNKAAEKLIGFKKEELIGKSIFNLKLISHDQIEKISELLVRNVKGHPTGPDEIVFNRNDGKKIDVEIRTYPVKIKDQNFVLGIARDITDRKKWMDELEKSFSITMATLESTDEGILVTDNNGDIKIFNRRFVDIWKIPEQIMVNRDYNGVRKFFIEQFKHSETILESEKKLNSNLANESFDILRTKNNKIFECSSKPQRVGNKIVGRVWSFRDITQHKQMEEELKRYTEHLEEEVKQRTNELKMASLGQLVAGVAHEINNPLGYIMSNTGIIEEHTQSLKESYKEDQPPQALENIHDLLNINIKGLDRIATITKSLKRYATPNTGDKTLVNINQGIKDTLLILYNQLKHRINVHEEYGEVPDIKCNIDQLNQVFMNLVLNSSQAMDQGDIWVRTWADNNNIYTEIKDNGKGIPNDILNKIFDPFFTTKENGTGLGLSLCYRIINDHRGNIKVESKIGEGTKILISIPMEE